MPRDIPLLLGGNVPKGYSASKSHAIAQRAKVGYCPCFTVATRVVIPATSVSGKFRTLYSQGVEFWQQRGPWGARRLAAGACRTMHGRVSHSWHWASRNLSIKTPAACIH